MNEKVFLLTKKNPNQMKALKELGGNLNLSIVHFKKEYKHLFILFQKIENLDQIVLALLLETKETGVVYIEALDTTGFFEPREHQSMFTKRFVIESIKSFDPTFLCVFSLPKEDLIFNKSKLNEKKRMLGPRKLQEYWIKIFNIIKDEISNDKTKHGYECKSKMHVYSNYTNNKSYPYTNDVRLSDIHLFEDDPKRKMINEIEGTMDIRTFYELLLVRSDFYKGSLIYSACGCNLIGNKELKRTEFKELNFLRKLDFSSKANSILSTKAFINEFSIYNEFFTTEDSEIKMYEKENNEVIKLNTRKRNNF